MFDLLYVPPILNDEMIRKSISLLPSNIITIVELYKIDIKKFISKASGLIQTMPLLKAYDFSDSERKILIDYACYRQQEVNDKEEKYLEIFEKEIDNGDYCFMDLSRHMQNRIKFREYEGNIREDLESTKFTKKDKLNK